LDVFSYVRPERRVAQDHPLCPLRAMTDEVLSDLQPWLNRHVPATLLAFVRLGLQVLIYDSLPFL